MKNMRISLTTQAVHEIETDVLAVPAAERTGSEVPDALRQLNEATGQWVSEVYESGEFNGKLFDLATLHRPGGHAAKRLALAGSGKPEKFGAAEMRKLAGALVRALKGKGARQVVLTLASADGEQVAAAAEGALLGAYEPDALKTDPKKDDKRIESFTIAVPAGSDMQAALDRGRILAEAQNLTRELVNEPANRLPPLALADRARAVANEAGLECEVLDRDRMAQLGMGALLGVAQGSDAPPALIILRYNPETPAAADHLALVGKGVTFDTGGVSIKPSDGMEKMKYDMAGGAAVIGAMRAIASLKPGVRVTGFIPAVENHVSGRAQRPGDIVTTLSGKTVEVLNTDAEGRLILADAMTYAIREGCTHIVDAATLTGAVVVALGHHRAGAFTNNEDLYSKLRGASELEGERFWQLPLDEDYKDYLKSAFADLPNVGPRFAGSITAAYFLKEFTEDKPWVHLDIAGTAWLDDAKPFLAKGPSGIGVRTFVRLVESW